MSRKLSFILLVILSGIFVFSFYGKAFLNPNSYIFSSDGDGIKNYYTYAYHIKNDPTFLHFEGMNYPYGAHFIYTDGHPAISTIVKSLSIVFPGIINYSIGILNFFMLLSFFLTGIFLWLIFYELKVDSLLSAIGSVGIMILAPQVFRMTGHLSLSYSFFIPLTIWLLLKSQNNPESIIWIIIQSLNILFWFFIHPYLGMMGVCFIAAYWVFYSLSHVNTEKRNLKNYLRFILWTIFPVIFFLLFVKITDEPVVRSTNPLGFFSYNAEPDDVFLPHHPPLRPLFEKFTPIKQQWEALSYIGLLSIGMLLYAIFVSTKSLIKKAKSKYLMLGEFRYFIWAGVVLLIFSFGMPFKLFPESLDWIPLIKQFRATGRFTWFFFFTINIMTVIILNNFLKFSHARSKTGMLVLFIIFLCFNIAEGIPYHLETGRELIKEKNPFRIENTIDEFSEFVRRIDPISFQAIIPIPFYYNGSENFSIPDRGQTIKNSCVLSYHTGLPILGGSLSRMGIEQSKNIIQTISPDFYQKKILGDIKSEKSFLVLKSEGEISSYEMEFIGKSMFRKSTDEMKLYVLPFSNFKHNSAKQRIEEMEIMQLNHSFQKDGFLVSDTTLFLYFNDFENQNGRSCNKPGTFCGKKTEQLILAEFGPETFETGKAYSVSAWFFNGEQDALNNWFRFRVEEYDPVNNEWFVSHVLPENSQVIDGDWSLVELEFTVSDSKNYISIKTIGQKNDHHIFYLDDLLIRDKKNHVFRIDKTVNGEITELFYNNQRIRVPE